MPRNPSTVQINEVDLVNARHYHDHATTSNVVTVKNGAHYSRKTRIKAEVYNRVEVAASSDPLEKLYEHAVDSCMHNSADRVDAPKCHEETRTAVQGDIFSWVSHGAADQIMWLTGPAGAGKSAIMGTVADKLRKKGNLAATYFFSGYSGSAQRKSKRGFVATLAYQIHRHKGLGSPTSLAILAAVKNDPAVFQMSLREQMRTLILRPLRKTRGQGGSVPRVPAAIIVDGVDECGEESGRSRHDDQIEVLSLLLLAIREPEFPFRIVIASRPEAWIRDFFTHTASGSVTEIFLNNKYNPDGDIRLFLESKFAEISRRCGFAPLTWPTKEIIERLVAAASGQFIYAATVVRFVDTPGTLPQDQLDIVVKIKPQDMLQPFATLDALYTSILLSSPKPSVTVLWLKAQQTLRERTGSLRIPPPSAWTTDRLFEANPGEARMLLELPSLAYVLVAPYARFYDSSWYGQDLEGVLSLGPDAGWNAEYSFYHHSFLEYLKDRLRCGAAFPDVDDGKVEGWIAARCAQVLACGGPEVPISPAYLLTFKQCFIGIWTSFAYKSTPIDNSLLSKCEPTGWLVMSLSNATSEFGFLHLMFWFVHRNCRPYRPCNAGCKRWRREIAYLPKNQWRREEWTSFGLFLDRFCVKRLGPRSVLAASQVTDRKA